MTKTTPLYTFSTINRGREGNSITINFVVDLISMVGEIIVKKINCLDDFSEELGVFFSMKMH